MGCPWELLYADDLVLVAESVEELTRKFALWKQGLEGKGLRVNLGKTKVMVSLGGRGRKLRPSASRELVPTPFIVDSASTGYIIAPALASRVDSSLTQTMSADVACGSYPLPQLNNQSSFTLRVITLRQFRTSATLVLLLETLVAVWMQSLPESSLHGKVLENSCPF